MSICYPGSLTDLHKISGVGEQKLRKYGETFLKEIIDYCTKQGIEPKPSALKYQEVPIKQLKSLTSQVTLDLYKQGLNVQEIAAKKGVSAIHHLLTSGKTYPGWRGRFAGQPCSS